MNRIPMQIYFDPDTVEFYKQYAREEGKSFTEVIRQAVAEKKEKLKKQKKEHPFVSFIYDMRRKYKNKKTYYKNLSDDELLVAHEMQELDS